MVKEEIEGFIFSYPRSGNTWVRYIVEYFTEIQTRGIGDQILDKPLCDSGTIDLEYEYNKVILKRHPFSNSKEHFQDIIGNEDKWAIFILRNYKDAICRHCLVDFGKEDIFDNMISSIPDYMQCLDLYKKWQGPKLLIYYEDLIIKPAKTIHEIVSFLMPQNEETDEKFGRFLNHHEKHRKASVAFYHKQNISLTFGDIRNMKAYENAMAGSDRVKMDDIIIKDFRHYIKYIGRYFEG